MSLVPQEVRDLVTSLPRMNADLTERLGEVVELQRRQVELLERILECVLAERR